MLNVKKVCAAESFYIADEKIKLKIENCDKTISDKTFHDKNGKRLNVQVQNS